MTLVDQVFSNEVIAALIGTVAGAVMSGLLTAYFSNRQTAKLLRQERQLAASHVRNAFFGQARTELITILSKLLSPLGEPGTARYLATDIWDTEGQYLLKRFDLNQRTDWEALRNLHWAVVRYVAALRSSDSNSGSDKLEDMRRQAIAAWREFDRAVSASFFSGHRLRWSPSVGQLGGLDKVGSGSSMPPTSLAPSGPRRPRLVSVRQTSSADVRHYSTRSIYQAQPASRCLSRRRAGTHTRTSSTAGAAQ